MQHYNASYTRMCLTLKPFKWIDGALSDNADMLGHYWFLFVFLKQKYQQGCTQKNPLKYFDYVKYNLAILF